MTPCATWGWTIADDSSAKDVVLLIHGSNDAASEDVGERWWQRDSAFVRELQMRLGALGAGDFEVAPFHWSGENSETQRAVAAAKLRRTVASLKRATPGRRVHVVAHSHGGNVLTWALARGLARKLDKADSLICVGTPFFRRRIRMDVVIPLIGLYALGLGWLITLFFIGLLANPLFLWGIPALIAVMAVTAFVTLWGMTPVSSVNRRIRPILCIHSKWDEATRALAAAPSIRLRFVSASGMMASLWRGGRSLILLLLVLVLLAMCAVGPRKDELGYRVDDWGFLPFVAASIAMAAIGVLWGLAKYVMPALGLGHALASAVNAALHQILLATAYGDDSEELISSPSPTPHGLAFESEELQDDVVGNLNPGLTREKLSVAYERIMGFDPSAGLDALQLWTDLNGALYHNAYFDDGRVQDRIVSFITSAQSVDGKRR